MKGDLTAESHTRHDTRSARAASTEHSWRSARIGGSTAAGAVAAALLAALLIALCTQLPATHLVNVGGYDSAYVQGFYDPERADQPGGRPYLAGSDGAARWTRDISYLVFPQLGFPARVTLRLRGWRADGPAPTVRVSSSGTELASFQAGQEWQEHTFAIAGGALRPSDVVLEIRTDTARLSADDARQVGVLLDSATYSAGPPPIAPYPAQLAYAALAGGMLYALLRRAPGGQTPPDGRPAALVSRRALVLGLLAMCLAYLALYRFQLPYPYPLRRLPQAICLVLAGLLALRYAPAVARRAPWLPDAAAAGGIGVWTAAVLVAAGQHLTLSIPGVEKDFRVFATRAFDAAEVFRADGFYNLGYPLLLWLATPLAQGNPFLAARALAALSGALMLAATWWLARSLLGRGAALIALAALALSPFVVQYALYVGSDMPFAALCALTLALLLAARRAGGQEGTPNRLPIALCAAAGLAGGAAFLVRHPGVLLLPLGWAALAAGGQRVRVEGAPAPPAGPGERLLGLLRSAAASLDPAARRRLAVFTLAFALAILPQVIVNLRDTGQPLYSLHAKNVWLAVYGDGDWGRWGEQQDDISFAAVALQDPGRLAASWWANVRAFFGTGAEDTGEFGRAIQLRLLGFPANWLAVAGMIGWLVRSVRRPAAGADGADRPFASFLVLFVLLYVAAIAVGLTLPRFFLPLAPVYAIAAAWACVWLIERSARERSRPLALAVMLAGALLWGGFASGVTYVVRPQPDAETPGQPAEALAAAQLVQATLRPGERLVIRAARGDEAGLALAKYSAIAHLVLPEPAGDDPESLRASGAQYLLWSAELGPPPGAGEALGAAGRYTLVRLN